MTWQFTPFPLILIFISAGLLVLTRFVWLRHTQPGGIWLVGFLIANALWSLAVAFELASLEVWADIFWSQVSYPGIVAAPVFFFLFVVDYCRQSQVIAPRWRWTLWIIPAITVLLVFSNDLHHWIWTAFTPGVDNLVVYWYGPWFWIYIAYLYTLIVLSIILLIVNLFHLPRSFRGQLILLLVAGLFPVASSVGYTFKLFPPLGLDPTPMTFAVTAVILVLNLLRFRMLDLVPVARGLVFVYMSDGVIVVDSVGRIVDVNPAAQSLVKWVHLPQVGMHIDDLLAPYPELLKRYSYQELIQEELKIGGDSPQYLELSVKPLYDDLNHYAGRLIVFSDVTERKKREDQLHNSEVELRALYSAMTSDVIFVMDRDGHYLNIAPTNPKLLYRPSVELLGKTFTEVLPPLVAEKSVAHIRRALDTGRILNYEYPLLIGQQTLWFDATISPITSNTVFWVAHDITHHKRIEEAESRARQRSEILNEIIQSISGRMPFDHLLELVDHQVNRIVKAGTMVIASYQPGDEEYQVAYLREPGNTLSKGDRHRLQDSITGYVIQQGKPIFLNNTSQIDDFLLTTGRHFRKNKPRSMMAVPLTASGQTIGALAIFNYDEENCFSEDDYVMFSTIAAQVSIAFENFRLFSELEQLALTDSLTGLFNRRHFFSLSSHEFERSQRYSTPLAAVMIDLDHFKRINDTYGHAGGDQVLRSIAAVCQKQLRRIDIIGRYGGEEFAVLMPDTDLPNALLAAARLVEMIAAEKVQLSQEPAQITASLGVAVIEAGMPNLETLLDHADQAMYAAKKAGRNRVETYTSTTAVPEN